MGQLIELLGSIIIGSYIMLLVLGLNLRMNDSASQYYQNTFTQMNTISTARTLEYDFYKAGYNAGPGAVLAADSALLTFKADLSNSADIDTVKYYLSAKTAASFSANPNDMILYRQLNGSSAQMVSVVSGFKITYYDTLNTKIAYSALATQAGRNKIRAMEIYLKLELADSTGNTYAPVELKKLIRPRNL